MSTQDELPGFLSDALDYPLVGPIGLIVLGLAVVLFLAWLWDDYAARELDRHRLHARIHEYESAARRADLDARLAEIDDAPLDDEPAGRVDLAAWQMWADEPGVRKP